MLETQGDTESFAQDVAENRQVANTQKRLASRNGVRAGIHRIF